MTITIDRAGRVVIPKPVREQFSLWEGSELEVEYTGNEIRLTVADLEPRLIEKGGLLIHHGASQGKVNLVAAMQEEKEQEQLRTVDRWDESLL